MHVASPTGPPARSGTFRDAGRAGPRRLGSGPARAPSTGGPGGEGVLTRSHRGRPRGGLLLEAAAVTCWDERWFRSASTGSRERPQPQGGRSVSVAGDRRLPGGRLLSDGQDQVACPCCPLVWGRLRGCERRGPGVGTPGPRHAPPPWPGVSPARSAGPPARAVSLEGETQALRIRCILRLPENSG